MNFCLNVFGKTCLVTVTPREVLDANILVWVLGALLKRGHVLPVLPVLRPEVVGVEATTNQAGNDSTFIKLVSAIEFIPEVCFNGERTRWTICARGLGKH